MTSTNRAIVKKLIDSNIHTSDTLHRIKRDILRARNKSKTKVKQPTKSELLTSYKAMVVKGDIEPSENVEKLLQKGSIRSLSGISAITVLTKPYACPGKCVYCPTESIMPKSYLSNEPAAQRALRNKFDPWMQISNRICMLEGNGHTPDKVELIVKGGTWNAYRYDYQLWFIRRCFEICNQYGKNDIALPPDDRALFWGKDIDPKTTFTNKNTLEVIDAPEAKTAQEIKSNIEYEEKRLKKAQKINETAKYRIIGLTLETRPDWIRPEEISRMRSLGCTRVEVGLQHTNDKILKLIKRGHTLNQFKKGIRMLRDAGFKVDFHTMPHLPGSTPELDIEMYKKLYEDKGLKPDMIKIYPCVVVPLSELYDWHEQGKFKPYPEKELTKVLKQAKLLTPKYCRISRLIRDIPSDSIVAGNQVTNLRENLQKEIREEGNECVCLRCREIGRQIKIYPDLFETEPQLYIDQYETDGGDEYFLSFEDEKRKAVFAFLRLRLPLSQDKKIIELMPEINGTAFIRELHTYGHLVPINKKANKTDSQHKGLGKKLMKKAESIAKNKGYTEVAVISGIGVREYYKKLGYELKGTYMKKTLRP